MTSKTMNDFVSNEDSIESMGVVFENEESDYFDFVEYEDKIKYAIEKKMYMRSISIVKSNMYQRLLKETMISKKITNTRFIVVTGLDNRNMVTQKRLYYLIEYITKLVKEGKYVRLISIFNDVRDIDRDSNDIIYYDSQGILNYHFQPIENYVSKHPDRSNILHIDNSYL